MDVQPLVCFYVCERYKEHLSQNDSKKCSYDTLTNFCNIAYMYTFLEDSPI